LGVEIYRFVEVGDSKHSVQYTHGGFLLAVWFMNAIKLEFAGPGIRFSAIEDKDL
jgi:hypothetical protein